MERLYFLWRGCVYEQSRLGPGDVGGRLLTITVLLFTNNGLLTRPRIGSNASCLVGRPLSVDASFHSLDGALFFTSRLRSFSTGSNRKLIG